MDWAAASGDTKALGLVTQVVNTFLTRAVTVLDDRTGKHWEQPSRPGSSVGATWCHGLAGIGQLLLRYGQVQNDQEVLPYARGAALTAASRHRAASSVLCHGLSGTLSPRVDRSAVSDATLVPAFASAAVSRWAPDRGRPRRPGAGG
ncbi:lanthionine synthetase LanC family protein [Actinopolymorpha singaporensis]